MPPEIQEGYKEFRQALLDDPGYAFMFAELPAQPRPLTEEEQAAKYRAYQRAWKKAKREEEARIEKRRARQRDYMTRKRRELGIAPRVVPTDEERRQRKSEDYKRYREKNLERIAARSKARYYEKKEAAQRLALEHEEGTQK